MTGTPAPADDPPLVDEVLAARARSSGEFLAGLIVVAQLATVGRPERLPEDEFADVDPTVVRRIWDRGLAVGLHAGRLHATPRLYRDQMERMRVVLEKVGFHAMAGAVDRSLRLVAPESGVHPADGEGPRGH